MVSALPLAAHAGNDLVVRLLVKYGIAVNHMFSDAAKDTNYAALPLAALARKESTVPLLINLFEYENSTSDYSALATDSTLKLRILRELRVEANRLTGMKE